MSAERKRSEKFVRRPVGDGVPSAAGLGGLSEEEAYRVAEKAVREVRRERGRNATPPEETAPSPEEVRRILSPRMTRSVSLASTRRRKPRGSRRISSMLTLTMIQL